MSYAYAFSLAHANDPTRAVEVLNRLAQQSLPPDMMMGVGDLYSQTGDYDDALKVYLKSHPGESNAAASTLLRG